MPLTLADVGIGAAPGDGTGDPARTAFSTINANNALIEAADAENIKRDGSVDFTAELGTDVGTFRSDVADGPTAVGFAFNTSVDMVNATAKLLSLRRGGVEKAYFDKDGLLRNPAGNHGLSVGSNEQIVGYWGGGVRFTIRDSGGVALQFSVGTSAGVRKMQFTHGGGPSASSRVELVAGALGLNGTVLTHAVRSQNRSEVGSFAGPGHHLEVLAGNADAADATGFDGGNLILSGGAPVNTGAFGKVIVQNLPTSDPVVAGALWNNAGVLNISAG